MLNTSIHDGAGADICGKAGSIRARSTGGTSPQPFVMSRKIRIAKRPQDYRWSGAAVHFGVRADTYHVIDLTYWERSGGAETWREMFAATTVDEQIDRLRMARRLHQSL
jgi:hypothetical protein